MSSVTATLLDALQGTLAVRLMKPPLVLATLPPGRPSPSSTAYHRPLLTHQLLSLPLPPPPLLHGPPTHSGLHRVPMDLARLGAHQRHHRPRRSTKGRCVWSTGLAILAAGKANSNTLSLLPLDSLKTTGALDVFHMGGSDTLQRARTIVLLNSDLLNAIWLTLSTNKKA
ncbi:hypothetical protein FIBSPDRAFT_1048790 [Athelia psychrophila]|uniref:Uncharacterized protein n=1 Tax=Athelia psychrophila TaxID=1759441 RepID=A0A166D9E8_9AGAM|nr:hypothetical protein FIBSPDRAFT_1048790 [Fibularhizoctonia sp. CBS 109695]